MSNTLFVSYLPGRKVAATLFYVKNGTYWNFTTGKYETFNPANASQYGLMLSDPNGKGDYTGTFPQMNYPCDTKVTYYDVAGDAYALGDIPIANEDLSWDGVQIMTEQTGQVFVTGFVNDASPAKDAFMGNQGLSSVDDFYCGTAGKMKLCFTTGALKGLNSSVLDYIGATRKFVVKAFPVAPANGDQFKLLAGN